MNESSSNLYDELEKIGSRPEPFRFYTAKELWNDEHTSQKMLEFHLDGAVDVSSRRREFIGRSVEWMVSLFMIGEKTKILDFGCGPGLYTTLLAGKKANVTGIDFSERSISYAKETAAKKGLEIDYVLGNYLDFETEKKFDLVLMIMCDYCALSPSQRNAMARKFFDLLESGGSVLLDVYSLNAFDRKEEVSIYRRNLLDGFWSPENYHGFLNTFKYDEEKVVLEKYTVVEKRQTKIVYNWLQYFSRESLADEFEKQGFEAIEFFSDVAGSPFQPESDEFAMVAKKPRANGG